MDKLFKVCVPDNKSNKIITYPMTGFPLYSKLEAVKVMEKFGRKSPKRIDPDSKLEVWATAKGCNFTLQDYRDDINGIRTEN